MQEYTHTLASSPQMYYILRAAPVKRLLVLCLPLAQPLSERIESKVNSWSHYLQANRCNPNTSPKVSETSPWRCPIASIRPSLNDLEQMVGDFYEYTAKYALKCQNRDELYIIPYFAISYFVILVFSMTSIVLYNFLDALLKPFSTNSRISPHSLDED